MAAYASITCDRCGRVFMSSEGATRCLPCQRRVANGKALAARRKEQIQEERAADALDLDWVCSVNRRIRARLRDTPQHTKG